MCEFSAFRHFFKTNVAQFVTELIFYSKTHEMWSFSIKFGELRYKNVNKQQFHDKTEFYLKTGVNIFH